MAFVVVDKDCSINFPFLHDNNLLLPVQDEVSVVHNVSSNVSIFADGTADHDGYVAQQQILAFLCPAFVLKREVDVNGGDEGTSQESAQGRAADHPFGCIDVDVVVQEDGFLYFDVGAFDRKVLLEV